MWPSAKGCRQLEVCLRGVKTDPQGVQRASLCAKRKKKHATIFRDIREIETHFIFLLHRKTVQLDCFVLHHKMQKRHHIVKDKQRFFNVFPLLLFVVVVIARSAAGHR